MFRYLLLLAALLCFGQSSAQTTDQNYPVTAQAFVVAQPNQKLAAYFSSNRALTVSLLLKDLTKTSVQAYLRWSIDGPGVHLSSIDGHIPAHFITLQRGMMQRLSGLDLQSDYFLSNQILAEGLAGPPLRTSLPEGFYTFRVQALEAGTGREVSNWGETYFSITTPLPPVINIPFNGAELIPTEAQKNGAQAISIQWMPRHYRLPGSITSYDLKVCKVPDGYEPTEALEACVSPIIDDKGNPGTFYPGNTGIGNSIIGAFEMGEKYAARVTIHEFDQNGDEILFANEGRSEVTWFRFGKECVSPKTFEIKEVGPGRLQLTWEKLNGVDSYTVFYRKEGDNQWTSQPVAGTTTFIANLVPDNYELAVQASCSKQFPDNVQTWEIEDETDDWEELPLALTDPMQLPVQAAGCVAVTPGKLSDYYANFPGEEPDSSKKLTIPTCALLSSTYTGCNDDHPVITPPTTGTELTELKTGDVLGIYDYTVFVAEAIATPEGFTGKGFVRIPFLEGTLLLADFSGVKVWKTDGNGGCVYESGRFESKGQTQAETAFAMSKLMTTLAGENSPNTYAGTLAGALQEYDALSKNGDSSQICQYKAAILEASAEFKAALEEVSEDEPDPRTTAILQDLEAITSQLQADSIIPNLTQKYEALFARLELLKKQLQEENTPPDYQITNIQLSNLQMQSAKINWQLSGGEVTRYVVEYRDPGGATRIETLDSPQVNLQGLKESRTYTYKILAYQGDKIVATSPEGQFTTLAKEVPRPENLTYTILSDKSVKITWDKNTQHKDFKLVYTDGKGNWQAVFPTTNEVTLTGLDPSQLYDYEIVAYDNARVESAAANSQVTTAEQCQLNVTMLNARNTSILRENEHFLWANGCSSTTLPTSIQWSNGTLGVISSDGIITFGDGETGKLVLTSSSSRRIFVNPEKSKSYTAICTMGEGVNKKICTYTVDVKVPSNECGPNFAIGASADSIELGKSVVLGASTCYGKKIWSHGLGEDQVITVFPSSDMSVYAICTTSEKVCYSNFVNIKVRAADCDLKTYISNKNVETGWFGSHNRKMTVHAIGCENGTINWDVSGGVKQKNVDKYAGYVSLEKIKNDVTVVAKCTLKGATSSCKEVSLTSKFPYVDCNEVYLVWKSSLIKQGYVDVYGMKGNVEFKLIDEQGKEYSSFFDDAQQKNIVQLPVLDGKRIYHAVFPGKSCTYDILIEAYKLQILASTSTETTQSIVNPVTLKISEYSNSSRTVKCNGRIVWTNDKDGNSIEAAELVLSYTPTSDNSLPFPTVTTTYYAACHITNEDGSTSIYPAINSKQIVVSSDYCFRIESDKNKVNRGDKINLTAIGCTEAFWSQGDLEIGLGKTITTTPVPSSGNTISYKATCPELSGCSETITIQVLPCNFKITPSKTFAKIAERVFLTASGCSGGKVQWSTGETGDSITVRPLDKMTYMANCMVEVASVCEDSVTITVDNLPPDDIVCPQFELSASAVEQCSEATIVPSGCPANGHIIWEETTTTSGSESYKVVLNKEKTIKATCITVYDQKVTSEITLTPTAPELQVSPGEVYAGMKAILRASGCYNSECGNGVYNWKNNTTGSTYTGSSIEVRLNDDTNFTVSCNGGIGKTFPIKAKVVACEVRNYDQVLKGNSSSVEMNASWCDTQYPINWFFDHPFFGSKGWDRRITEFPNARNRRKHTVQRPADVTINNDPFPSTTVGVTDVYYVHCVKLGQSEPCKYAFYVDSPLLNQQKPDLTNGITEPANTPDPCNEFEFIEKKRGDTDYRWKLFSDWCPGSKVIWYRDQGRTNQIASLIPPEEYPLGRLSVSTSFYYSCFIDNNICQGEVFAKINQNGAREAAAATTTSTVVDQQCSSTIPLATAMAEEYSELICQLLEAARGDDDTISQTEAEGLLAKVKNASQNAYPDYNLEFPVDEAPVVSLIMKEKCVEAGGLLAAPNTGLVEGDKFDEDKGEVHGEILMDVAEATELSSMDINTSALQMPIVVEVKASDNNEFDNWQEVFAEADRRDQTGLAEDMLSHINKVPSVSAEPYFKEIVSVWNLRDHIAYSEYLGNLFTIPLTIGFQINRLNGKVLNVPPLIQDGTLNNLSENFIKDFFRNKIRGYASHADGVKSMYTGSNKELYESTANNLLNHFYGKTGNDYYATKTIAETIYNTDIGKRRIENMIKIFDRFVYLKIGPKPKPLDSDLANYKRNFGKLDENWFKTKTKLNVFPSFEAGDAISFDPRAGAGDEEKLALYTIGGTQGIEVRIKEIKPLIDVTTRGYEAVIVIRYLDTFGVSESDYSKSVSLGWNNFVSFNYRGGVLSQWVLQHQYAYKPFTDYLTYIVKIKRTWTVQ